MLSSSIPTKFSIPFANAAGPGFITTVPETTADPTRASLTKGFPPNTFQQLAAGGNPPFGADFNGLLKQMTAWLQWVAAGGVPVSYDATFQTKIGGYPAGALIQAATADRYWISSADNNLTNPDTGGAGWLAFPDVIVQKQAGNFAVDTGAVNNYTIALTPSPKTLADIIGSPIRVLALHANTVNNPLIHINAASGSTTATMINSNGSPLLIGQIARAGQIFEGFLDNAGFFQVTTPAPIAGGVTSGALTGVIYEWGSETPPTWGLECNGALYNISDYPNLWNVIQNRFNAGGSPPGDGVNTFNVPDKRGAFTRGWDHGRGLDPDASLRTTTVNGAVALGDHVGSWQSYDTGTIIGSMIYIYNPQTVQTWPGMNWPSIVPPPTSYWRNMRSTGVGSREDIVYPPLFNYDEGAVYDWFGSFDDENPPFHGFPVTAIRGSFNMTAGNETRPVNIDMMYVIAF